MARKLLPIVLVPLLIGRIRIRDAAIGALLLWGLYFHYHDPGALTFGAVPNVVAYIRFNGPVFRALAAAVGPQGAAGIALLAGLAAALAARVRYEASDPEACGAAFQPGGSITTDGVKVEVLAAAGDGWRVRVTR